MVDQEAKLSSGNGDWRDQLSTGSQARIKVLDISTHWSGSVASRHLAHLGADVIKLENPRIGDGNRGLAPLIAGEGLSHIVLNAGKRSAAVDRRSDGWSEILRRAALWADVVIVGSQPGIALARGLDFGSFRERNDRIVYCNISGYGEVGPWADYPLHGLNGDVAAGLVPVELVDGLPIASLHYRSVGTTLAGIHAALGIMEALRRRDSSGEAQRVSASVWESSMFWQWRDLTNNLNSDAPPAVYADLGARYAMYQTKDARIILVCPIERKFWERFCVVLDLPAEWKSVGTWDVSGMDWGAGRTDERRAIADRMLKFPLTHWTQSFEAAGIPFSPLYLVEEAAQTGQATAVGITASTQVNGVTVLIPNIPIHINAQDGASPRGPEQVSPPPLLGQHTAEFMKEIFDGVRGERS